METGDIAQVAALQKACFPDPFPEELLWSVSHLERHLELFPSGQFVAQVGGRIAGSASNTRISEENYRDHANWDTTVGGPLLDTFDGCGTTLYGLDISVHPEYRRLGLGRRLYEARFELVRRLALARYATGCRLPGLKESGLGLDDYLAQVTAGARADRTLTPLLRYGLQVIGGHEDYMEDEESRNCAALLEWRP